MDFKFDENAEKLREEIRQFVKENIPPDHWFWNQAISGGIFIEHGVHFFDLFEMWFGAGKVVAAQRLPRPGSTGSQPLFDQVNCTVVYPGALVANFYHGFHQAGAMDRQEIRIVCERGSIRLFEWVPCTMEIDALLSEAQIRDLEVIVPGFGCERVGGGGGGSPRRQQARGRGKPIAFDGRYSIRGTLRMSKTEAYGMVLRSLMEDQVKAAVDPGHSGSVTGENGFRALALAVDCESLAERLEHGIPRQQYPS